MGYKINNNILYKRIFFFRFINFDHNLKEDDESVSFF